MAAYEGEFNYNDFNGNYFAFCGLNATTGTPNKITGRMSTYGRCYGPFDNRKDAKDFAENNDDGMAQTISVVGTARTLRKYFLGSSLQDYFMDLYCLDY